MTDERIETERKAYLDGLRALAAFAVVLLHTAAHNWTAVDVRSGSWLAMNLYECLSRWAVPVFVMISGANLLGRDIPLRKLYGKYVLRLVTAFLFWGILYAVFLYHDGSMGDFARAILTGNYHMWYLPLAAGLYLCQPLLRQLVKNRRTVTYCLVLSGIFAFLLPFVMRLLDDFGPAYVKALLPSVQKTLDNMYLYPVMGYTGYFLLGYMLAGTELTQRQRRLVMLGLPVGLLLALGLNTGYSLLQGSASTHYYQPLQPQTAMMAAGIFLLARGRVKTGSPLAPALRSFSRLTFGIYLIHPMVLNHLELFGLHTLSFTPWLSIPVLALAAFALSALFAWLLGKVPIIGKYVV